MLSSFFTTVLSNSKDKDNALPRIEADTLFTTNGYKLAEKQNTKITTPPPHPLTSNLPLQIPLPCSLTNPTQVTIAFPTRQIHFQEINRG